MELLLHPRTSQLLAGVGAGRQHAYIFEGPRGSGKMPASLSVAARLICPSGRNDGCSVCIQLANGNHPDVIVVTSGDKTSIGVEPARQLVRDLAVRPYAPGGARIVIVDQAEVLTIEAQNALLKLIEEPGVGTLILLLAVSAEALLPTIRSRATTLSFAPVSHSHMTEWLQSRHHQTPVVARGLAARAQGRPGYAVTLLNDKVVADQATAIEQAANELVRGRLFGRLLSARDAADQKLDPMMVADALSRWARDRVQASDEAAAAVLVASEHLRQATQAHVTPRAAFERFVLETPS